MSEPGLLNIRGEKEERNCERMRSWTLLDSLLHLNCSIVTPPPVGGHMNMDERWYSATRWLIGNFA